MCDDMNADVADTKREDGLHHFGSVLPYLPSLMFKFGKLFLRFKRDAKKGGSIFCKELIDQGIDPTTAEELTRIYLESSNIFRYMDFLK